MRIFVMSRNGDDVLGEWTPGCSTAEIADLEVKFARLRSRGYRAFGVSSGSRFDRLATAIDEDLLLVAPMVGG